APDAGAGGAPGFRVAGNTDSSVIGIENNVSNSVAPKTRPGDTSNVTFGDATFIESDSIVTVERLSNRKMSFSPIRVTVKFSLAIAVRSTLICWSWLSSTVMAWPSE